MRKIIIIFAVVILCGSARADDYLDSLRECYTQVKQNLNMQNNGTEIADSIVAKSVREAAVLLAVATGSRETSDTFVTVSRQQRYSIDSQIVSIDRVYFISSDTLRVLKPIGNNDPYPSSGYSLCGQNGIDRIPGYYRWVYYPDSGYVSLQLYAIPCSDGDTMIVEGSGKITNIMSDSTFVSQIPVIYRSLITSYATSKTAKTLGMESDAAFYWNLMRFQMRALGIPIEIEKY